MKLMHFFKQAVSTFLAAVILCCILVVATRNFIVARFLETQAERVLGLDIVITSFDINFTASHILAKGVIVNNPKGFGPEPLCIIPSVEIVCDPFEFFTKKKTHFYFLDVAVKEINIIKKEGGVTNINATNTVKDREAAQNQKLPFYVDVLRLSLDTVHFTDQSRKKGYQKEYKIKLNQTSFSNVDSPHDIMNLIFLKALENTNIGKFVSLSIIPIGNDVRDVVKLPGHVAYHAIKAFSGVTSLFGSNPQ